MRLAILRFGFVTMLLALQGLLAAGAAAGVDTDLSHLAWLEGTWEGTQDGVRMEEHWSSPDGQGMVGMHKDVRAGKMVSFEFFRVAPTPNDGVCYFASPNAAAPTAFYLIESKAKRVVFENRNHDFPQRVLYWMDDAGRLHARIEGAIDGKERFEEWVWTKRK